MNSPTHKVGTRGCFLWKRSFLYINTFLFPSDIYAILSS